MSRNAALGTIPGILVIFGCSLASLSPTVEQNAEAYHNDAKTYDNRLMLMNVLRARDYEPLNFTSLTSITSTISASGTFGLSKGFGPHQSGGTSMISPSVTASTSPTTTLNPLDTQGFTVGIIQPIAPIYVANKWDSQFSRELLILLFAKSIKLPTPPVALAGNEDAKPYLNNPDNPEDIRRFMSLLKEMMAANLRIKLINILEPVGPDYNPNNIQSEVDTASPAKTTIAPTISGQTIPNGGSITTVDSSTVTTSKATTLAAANPAAAATLQAYGTITGLGDGQYHIGYEPASGGPLSGLRLYHVYQAQAVLCVDPLPDHHIYPIPNDSDVAAAAALGKKSKATTDEEKKTLSKRALALTKPITPPPASPAPATTPKAAAQPASATASATVSTALQANRVSSILENGQCNPSQIVLTRTSEEDFQKLSQNFATIEWRSISEVVQYLGAVIRYNNRNAQRLAWGKENENTIFTPLLGTVGNRISVTYDDVVYSVPRVFNPPGEPVDPDVHPHDHSLQAIDLLSELYGTVKVSSDLPVTTQLLNVPAP